MAGGSTIGVCKAAQVIGCFFFIIATSNFNLYGLQQLGGKCQKIEMLHV